jgi:hypothetical protein
LSIIDVSFALLYQILADALTVDSMEFDSRWAKRLKLGVGSEVQL